MSAPAPLRIHRRCGTTTISVVPQTDAVPAESAGVEVSVLGPLALRVGGVQVAVTGKQAAVLALDAGRVVSVDRLIDGVWGERRGPAHGTGESAGSCLPAASG